MKRFFLLVIIFVNAISYSQDVLQVIGNESCECLAAKKLDYSKLSKAELQAQVGLCIIKSYTNHISEFKAEDKVSFDDTAGMRKLGENVAIKMLVACPETLMKLGEKTIEEQEVVEEETADSFIEGEVTEIKTEQFISLFIKDNNGRNYNFILLDYFESAAIITNNELKKKDFVKVSYTEIELYDPKNKEFRYFKIITGLEKK